MTNAFDLTNRVAVITGGNGGIGMGMAQGLGAAGAKLFIVGRNAQKNEQAVASYKASGMQAQSHCADLTDPAQCEGAIQAAIQCYGGLDILVNNAGSNIRKPPQDYTVEEWKLILDTNLTSAFLCSKAAYPALKSAGNGKVINIGSMTSLFGASFAAAYSASKGGIVQMTRAFATAWAKDNIQVNAVLPGWVDTDLTKQSRKDVEGLHERVLARTPAGRWGIPEDFAGIAAFLASRASDFITGAAIPVDGGFSVQV